MLFLLVAEYCGMGTPQFIYPSLDGHWGCLQFLAIVNKDAFRSLLTHLFFFPQVNT